MSHQTLEGLSLDTNPTGASGASTQTPLLIVESISSRFSALRVWSTSRAQWLPSLKRNEKVRTLSTRHLMKTHTAHLIYLGTIFTRVVSNQSTPLSGLVSLLPLSLGSYKRERTQVYAVTCSPSEEAWRDFRCSHVSSLW